MNHQAQSGESSRPRILGLVPARGGSKGVPRKNIAPICGKPLLAYTSEAALASSSLARVVLSTDDQEIAAVGKSLGLDVPFMRPTELAGDKAASILVVQHALRALEASGDSFDAVCLLQPTTPLRTAAMIDQACELFAATGADTVLSVLPIPHQYHPDWALTDDGSGRLHWASGRSGPPPRRQDLDAAYCREGSIYITRTCILLDTGSFYGPKIVPYLVDPSSTVNIDRPEDLLLAETLIRRQMFDAHPPR